MPRPYEQLNAATAHLETPFAAIDESALRDNADDLVRRAGGTKIRVATKSVRVRKIIEATLRRTGYDGVMSYSLPESNWLADEGIADILIAYPTVHVQGLRDLVAEEHRTRAITLMVDGTDQLDFIDSVVGYAHQPIRICIDVDASLHVFGKHLGVRRSPLRKPKQVAELAAAIAAKPGYSLVGVMFYDAQIAGLPDSSAAVRWMKKRSNAELRRRRKKVVAAVSKHATLEFVNGGGTGSLEMTGADPTITELTAGSGLFHPTLFDGYDAFDGSPAAFFALPVVRKPAAKIATLFSGGFIASGPPGDNRQPKPVWPHGLETLETEACGEVQTPVTGKAAADLVVGDRVWLRHAKAGEMCERFDSVHLISDSGSVTELATYRGEGKNFG